MELRIAINRYTVTATVAGLLCSGLAMCACGQSLTPYPNTGAPQITARASGLQTKTPIPAIPAPAIAPPKATTPAVAARPAYPSTGGAAITPRPVAGAIRPAYPNTGSPTITARPKPSPNPTVVQIEPGTLNLNPPIREVQPREPVQPAQHLIGSKKSATARTASNSDNQTDESLPTIRIASPIRTRIPEPFVGPGDFEFPTPTPPSVTGSKVNLPAKPTPPAQMFSGPTLDSPQAPIATPTTTPANAPATPPALPSLESVGPQFPTSTADRLPDPQENLLVPLDNLPGRNLPFIPLPKSPTLPPPALGEANPDTNLAGKDDGKAPHATTSPAPTAAGVGGDSYVVDQGFPCDYDDPRAFFDQNAFIPDPNYDHVPFDSVPEIGIYEGKWNMCSQRPLIELGRGVYRPGVVPKSYSFLGKKNLITPGFTLFGDFRTAIAANDNGQGDPQFAFASRLNLDFDLRLTATERIHAFWGPLDEDGRFTRVQSFTDGRNDLKFFEEFDDDFDTLFFEGDLGYMWGGMTDQWAPFDLPFVVGKFPLLFQNGVWINDAVEGFAFTLPAKHSRTLNWSNFDLTMFFLFDDIDSRAFNDDNAADAYGFNLFLEAYGGYTEAGYAFLDDRTGLGRSYHNMTIGYTRRYRQRLSNSVRVIVNSGQDPVNGIKTADGQVLLIENSLVSSNPTYFVPYFNMFAGFGTPQNLAGQSVLQNVGINFETDALTGYPKLDDVAQDTWGGAFGFNLLGPRFSWQWILEAAMVQDFSDNLNGDQYAVGTRIQKSINYAWLARFDAMYGLRENDADISGVRAELRWKF